MANNSIVTKKKSLRAQAQSNGEASGTNQSTCLPELDYIMGGQGLSTTVDQLIKIEDHHLRHWIRVRRLRRALESYIPGSR